VSLEKFRRLWFNLLTTTDEEKNTQLFSYNFYFQGDLLKE